MLGLSVETGGKVMEKFERSISPSRRLFAGRSTTHDADDRLLAALPNGLLGTLTAAILIIGVLLVIKS